MSPEVESSDDLIDNADETSGTALLQLMGNKRLAGRVSWVKANNFTMLRVDVPAWVNRNGFTREGYTRWYNPQAVYSITPCSPAVMLAAVKAYDEAKTPDWIEAE